MSTQTATAAQVPNDPDILTTQEPDMNPMPSSSTSTDASQTSPTKLYPRLQYKPPALGVNPAYDHALELIRKDRTVNLQRAYAASQKLKTISERPTTPASQIRDLKIYIKRLKEIADLNNPEIHWRHSKGDTDLSLPVYRLLAQRTWASKALHLLTQRIEQMNVVPDVIPLISPSVDVRLQFAKQKFIGQKKEFEVGQFLDTAVGAEMPAIEIQSFDDTSKTYSLAIVDPDVPDEENDTYTSYLHYLKTDIKLSATEHLVSRENGKVVHEYIPPHPQKGTPYHRYTVVVWEQPDQAPQPNAPLAGKHSISRARFDAQSYAQQNGLHAVGISFWRQIWDQDVAGLMTKYPEVGYVEKNFKRIKA